MFKTFYLEHLALEEIFHLKKNKSYMDHLLVVTRMTELKSDAFSLIFKLAAVCGLRLCIFLFHERNNHYQSLVSLLTQIKPPSCFLYPPALHSPCLINSPSEFLVIIQNNVSISLCP